MHLGLWARSRRFQLQWLSERIESAVPRGAPLVVAGDFNDWHRRASGFLLRELDLREVFEVAEGRPARSFPARMPMLALDRIYVRGLKVASVERHVGAAWSRLSDHVALTARLLIAA